MKPRLLDLFCGAGGAAMGYHRAGFEVVGVDINPQPHYPFTFVRGDALAFLWGSETPFDAIHASPPCQAFSITGNLARGQGNKASAVDLLTPIRPLLEATGLPYVIENVAGAPLRDPVQLCGSTFGLGVRRHRLFESNVLLMAHGTCRHAEQGRPIGVYGSPNDDIPQGGRTARTVAEAQEAMGIDWMPRWSELKEAVPPAFTEHIGRQLLAEGLREALASAIDDTLGPPADGISAAIRRSIVDLALDRAALARHESGSGEVGGG
jgi:DNA (cytosine-5)-methyltransferase 1